MVSCSKSESSRMMTRKHTSAGSALPELINTTDSVIHRDPHDGSRVLVGPPRKATIIISGKHTYTANVGFCGELKHLVDFQENLNYWRRVHQEGEAKLDLQEAELQRLKSRQDEARAAGRTSEIRELERQVILLTLKLKETQDDISRSQRRASSQKEIVERLEETMDQDFIQSHVKWESGWKKNIDTLEEANPDHTFEMAASPLEVKVKMVARGLENFPAHKMIRSLGRYLGIEETEEGLTIDFVPEEMDEYAWLSAYAACPLKEGMNEIVIDMEFSF